MVRGLRGLTGSQGRLSIWLLPLRGFLFTSGNFPDPPPAEKSQFRFLAQEPLRNPALGIRGAEPTFLLVGGPWNVPCTSLDLKCQGETLATGNLHYFRLIRKALPSII